MKKIAFVITAMARGGAERVISVLSNYYSNNGYKVSIVMLWHSTVDYELDKKIEVVDLSNDKIHPMIRLPFVASKLRKYLKKAAPDTVVSFIAQNNVITAKACRGLDIRFIPSERNDPSARKMNPLLVKNLIKAYSNSSLTVLQTERTKNYFPVEVQKNSVIIPNPIEIKATAAPICSKRFVTMGRLAPQKNHKMLLQAFKTVYEKHPEYTLCIYGEGSLRQELTQMISDLGLEGAVEMPGNFLNIHEKISDAYAFVLSSDFEGLSNALLEAMMMGLPCISTNCAGSDEAITDGENGLLVPVGGENDLSNAMLKLIEDRELRDRIANNAKASAEKYKTENVIELWTKAIEGE